MPPPSLTLPPGARSRSSGASWLAGCARVAAVATALLLGGRAFLACAVNDKLVDSPLAYDRERWLRAAEPWWADADRLRMRGSVLARHLRPGATREAVVAELGPPSFVRHVDDATGLAGRSQELAYKLGARSTDEVWLVATFSSDGLLTRAR